MHMTRQLEKRIAENDMRVAVIGLGYVGLPLAVEFAGAGFDVTGIDTDGGKVEAIASGVSYIEDVPTEVLSPLVAGGRLKATSDYSVLEKMDAVIICVPTPLRKTRDPDVSFIIDAAEKIAPYLSGGKIIVLESTTYPGTCEELIMPIFTRSGMRLGEDFHLAFSPERVDPRNPTFTTKNIPKVMGGMTPECTRLASLLYSRAIEKIITVSSPKTAEMVKLLENTFRAVNIGLVNEIALMCSKMGIGVWEVIDAAATKPFGFMPFYPGPGLGGHCLPVDPIYLSWKARLHDFEARFIDLAAEINGYMPHHVVSMIADALNEREKSLKGSKVLVIGVAYKKEVSDMRESPALAVMEQLQRKGAVLSYCDPHVPRLSLGGTAMEAIPLEPRTLSENDCAVIITDHSAFDYGMIVSNSDLVVDTRNATKGIDAPPGRIERL